MWYASGTISEFISKIKLAILILAIPLLTFISGYLTYERIYPFNYFLMVITLGGILNFIAIMTNGRKMPYYPLYYAKIEDRNYKPADENTKFRFLVDRYNITVGGKPYCFSIGDFVAFVGTFCFAVFTFYIVAIFLTRTMFL